jgi:hypothetical protein
MIVKMKMVVDLRVSEKPHFLTKFRVCNLLFHKLKTIELSIPPFKVCIFLYKLGQKVLLLESIVIRLLVTYPAH